MSSVKVNDLDLNSPESIRVNLEKFPGERVTLSLIGGGELQGVVNKVGATTLYITELTGKEFFDAIVRLDHISAITVKMRNK
ncbi:MAG: hypothetical protein A3H49_09890 [Nitrospirae bacterium RIFCSPLOWO2_02_FULL_62_14]|nr:MAG: hypothetical protein A3H49_09890 [Nitrospirae bacterium RIFCSPLOWO2_02_FULL_62_14]OGW70686.1 MAG: hypothetical protein A3A88_08345 [Nitrospirae bacterium RIFCSPLOWO2_01_FULL_62_17]OGW92272.1 MAG: hypothetical protein A3K11_02760 [Nitrospirae bacterium RIFCSPLOWO2_12_FULL_63_8]